jgi:hypothetical protein
VTITHGYLTLDEAQEYIGQPNGAANSQLEDTIEAVSRLIDGYCQRHFWKTNAGTARLFTAADLYVLQFGPFNDVVSVSAVTENGAAVTSYRLEPRNVSGPETRPYSQLRRTVGEWRMSTPDDLWEITVTGVFGWPAVPAAVKQAARLQVARVFKRADSPLGVAGFGEFGVVRVTQLDPDVKSLLAPYRMHAGFA